MCPSPLAYFFKCDPRGWSIWYIVYLISQYIILWNFCRSGLYCNKNIVILLKLYLFIMFIMKMFHQKTYIFLLAGVINTEARCNTKSYITILAEVGGFFWFFFRWTYKAPSFFCFPLLIRRQWTWKMSLHKSSWCLGGRATRSFLWCEITHCCRSLAMSIRKSFELAILWRQFFDWQEIGARILCLLFIWIYQTVGE